MSNYSKRASITTTDVETRGQTSILMESHLSNDELDRPDLAIVTDDSMASPNVAEYAKDLSFMNDQLTIMVGETTDPNAENPVSCGCNGEIMRFMRGVEYKVKRKFVDSLIKVEDRIKTVQYKDADGVDQTRIDRKPALKYPLSIMFDPAGDVGHRWFKHQAKNAW